MNFEYKEKKKKDVSFVSIRDRGENSLLEAKVKGNSVELVTYVHNDKTTHFTMPLELFEKMYKDLMDSK